MKQKESVVTKTAGIVKTTKAALSPKQLREHAEQSIADVAIARAAHRRKARSSAQAIAGLIPHGTDLPTDLSTRHNAYTGDLPLACRSGRVRASLDDHSQTCYILSVHDAFMIVCE
jgi:hypothetical protein